MPKNILVLGGGVYHIPLVKKAVELGHKTLAVSFLENDPALKYASASIAISSTDVAALSTLIQSENIDAVITTASDWNTFSQAELNKRFGFIGVQPEQVKAVSEKERFNLLLEKLLLPNPETNEVILSPTVFNDFKRKGKHIFKPEKGSGSADVFTTEAIFPAHLNGQSFLAQTFIEGLEFGGQAIIEKGEVIFVALSRKELINEVVPFAHVIGLPEMDGFTENVKAQLQKIVTEIDFISGTINFDIRENERELYIIDLSLRLSGNGLIEAINESYGINLFDYHIRQVLDEPRFLEFQLKKKIAVSIVLGTAKAEVNLAEIREKITFYLNQTKVEISELVWDDIRESEPFTKSKNRIGHAIFIADSEVELNQLLLKIKTLLGFN